MGWNSLDGPLPAALFAGLPGAARTCTSPTPSRSTRPTPADVAATTDHGGRFAAAVVRGNVAGVQFHPEKSQAAGARLLGQLPGVAAVILYPGHRPEGRPVRARGARRLRHRHRLQRRPGRPGAGLGRGRLRVAARGRPERLGRGQGGERRARSRRSSTPSRSRCSWAAASARWTTSRPGSRPASAG